MDLTPIVRFALLLLRPGMVVMLAPGLGGRQIPAMAKVALTVMAAIALMPTVVLPEVASSGLAVVILREILVGLSLAFVVQVLVAGAEFAGHLSSYQIGFSYGATIDPTSGVRSTMLVSLYGMLATLAFLGVNGHHALLRALAQSYEGVPIGAVQVDGSIVTAVTDMLAMLFVVGVRLAAPVLIVLLIVEVAIGLISRAAPSLNFMVIGYPLRIIVGLFLVAALIYTVPRVTESMIERALMLGGRTASAFR
jgi:flagellar biosynthetic protein FliR